MEASVTVNALNIGSLLVIFAVGGMFVVVLKSPANMRRLAAFLESRANAEEDIRHAVECIRNQQRAFQRSREIELRCVREEA